MTLEAFASNSASVVQLLHFGFGATRSWVWRWAATMGKSAKAAEDKENNKQSVKTHRFRECTFESNLILK